MTDGETTGTAAPAAPAGRPGPTPRSSARARREDVLRAATAHFAVGGLAGTSTEAIAATAGVSQPYLFRLFGTKKALFLATIERGHARIQATFEAEAERALRDGTDPFEAMGAAYIRLLEDRTELLCQLQAYAACDDPDVRAECRREWASLWGFLTGLPGGTPDSVRQFLATGMFLNVAAAMDVMAVAEPWARGCLGIWEE